MVFIRAKRVTDPLNEKVRARIRGDDGHYDTSSSGSDHEGTSFFSDLINEFLESDDNAPPDDAGSAEDESPESHAAEVAEMVKELLRSSDRLRRRVISDVCDAAKVFDGMPAALYRRAVMGRLRELGYNAGVCTARWESSGGLTAGSYEYVDVVLGEKMRYVVDLDFKAEFEIARATVEYEEVVRQLPKVMVAVPEELRRLVKMVAEAGRRSMKSKGLHVPPWRKGRYVVAKWLGPYRRTVNAGGFRYGAGEVKSRAVGFLAGDGDRVVKVVV
ncbi:Arc-type ribbon-helix-helix-containing protein [Dioscorea alata]|uniref:Arc-type ribbon-helix-helix-containing protein n=2 Tax=Dioscorea alata TaxID=55571 RepID=A0ACB7W5S2_DIOAL|nr:Arc-type ribbon-helix-helix-containing protein [Dioscorea alata]KAH7683014.1 Arc-type ribbon-helix-helix-containing protein [Dioscorea alata]